MFFCYFFFVSRRIDPPAVQIPFRAPREPLFASFAALIQALPAAAAARFQTLYAGGGSPVPSLPKRQISTRNAPVSSALQTQPAALFLERGGGQKQRRRHSHGVSAQSKVSGHNISIRQKVADARHEALQYFMVCKVAVRSRRCFFVERNSAGDFSDTP